MSGVNRLGGIMVTYLKNRTANFAWILGRQIPPGEYLNLNEVFEGFCAPKISSRDQLKKIDIERQQGKPISAIAEFKEDEFDLFMDWVENELAIDRGTWEIVRQDLSSSESVKVEPKPSAKQAKAKPAVTSGKRTRNSGQILAVNDVRRKIPDNIKGLSPKEIAWLPYNDKTKKLIQDMSADNIRDLKAAFRLVRNIAGQERTRKLIQDRIDELAAEGIS